MDFRDYPRALSYLREALVDTTRFFFDRSNIRARVELGNYFRTEQQLDSSDYYFRSIITSRDMIKFRPYYDHLALVELVCLRFAQRNEQAQAGELQVFHVDTGQFRPAQGPVEADQENGLVADLLDFVAFEISQHFLDVVEENRGLPLRRMADLALAAARAERS